MGRNKEKYKYTVNVRIAEQKTAVLEQIKKTPVIQIACERTGISRATFYRWKNKDLVFAKTLDEAIREGVLLVNDVAESQLMAAIRERNMTAIVFWLKHNHPSYKTKVEITARIQDNYELTPEQRALVEEALRRAALPSPGQVTTQHERAAE
jgi:ACT domain-containing protein